jgi:signal transduction histidine kinase
MTIKTNAVKRHTPLKTSVKSKAPPRQSKAAKRQATSTPRAASDQQRSEVVPAILRRSSELTALYETSQTLMEQHTLPELLQTIVERATDLLATPCGVIYLYDETQSSLELAAVTGFSVPSHTHLQLDQSLAAQVVRTHQPMIVDNAQSAKPPSEYGGISISAMLQVPMLYAGELIGVLGVAEIGQRTRTFTEDDARLLSLVAIQAASVVHNARLFEQVRSGRKRLEALSHRLLEAQEAERRGIARELHDEIGQSMTGVQLNLHAIDQFVKEPPARVLLKDSIVIIENVLQQVRDLSLALRPSILDDFGLVAALQWLVKRQEQRSGIPIALNADPLQMRPSLEVETVCFRVVQEALTNIMRHAHASHVAIELKEHDPELHLLIRDDGVGFDVSKAVKSATGGASLGLLGMQERVSLVGARMEIESAPGEGAIIRAVFSLNSPPTIVERRARRR